MNPKVTDQSLFGAAVTTSEPKPKDEISRGIGMRERTPYDVPASRIETTRKAAAPKPREESSGLEFVAFRIQQSLCLFPLSEEHFPTHAHKLKYLFKERGLDGPSNAESRAKVLDILRKQAHAMNEALKGFDK